MTSPIAIAARLLPAAAQLLFAASIPFVTASSADDWKNWYAVTWRATPEEAVRFSKQMGYSYIGVHENYQGPGLGHTFYKNYADCKGMKFYFVDPHCYRPVTDGFKRFINPNGPFTEAEKAYYNKHMVWKSRDAFPENLARGFPSGSDYSTVWDFQQQAVIDKVVDAIIAMARNYEAAPGDPGYPFTFAGCMFDTAALTGEFAVQGRGVVSLAYWTGSDSGLLHDDIVHEYATYSDGKAAFFKQLRARMAREFPNTKFIIEPSRLYHDRWIEELVYHLKDRPDRDELTPDMIVQEDAGTQFVDDANIFNSGLKITKEMVGTSQPNEVTEPLNRLYAAKAGINGAWYTWFGRWGSTGNMPNFRSVTDVYPRLLLVRCIPNWDNLHGIPLADRSWDGSVYKSPKSHIDSEVMYSRQPATGKLFAVFNTTNGIIRLGPGETVTSIQRIDGYFKEAGDGWSDCIVSGNEIRLKSGVPIEVDSANNQVKGRGYILTLNTSASPKVTTGLATDVTANAATLSGIVNPSGLPATVWFEYDAGSGSYARKSAVQNVGGSSEVTVNESIDGLSAGTTYYYRMVAQSGAGATNGSEKSFATLPGPSPPEPEDRIIVFHDAFADGERSTQNLPGSLAWYIGVAPDTVAIRNAALHLAGAGLRSLWAYFPPVELAVGESVAFGFDFSFAAPPRTNSGAEMRVALGYTNETAPLPRDGEGMPAGNYQGYGAFTAPTNAVQSTELRKRNGENAATADLLGAIGDGSVWKPFGSGGRGLSGPSQADAIYTGTLKVRRTSADTAEFTVSYTGGGLTESNTMTVADSASACTRFDTIAFALPGEALDGEIRIHRAQLAVELLPLILAQPTNASARPGSTAAFEVSLPAEPHATCQWQRLPAGSTAWINLVDDTTYANVTTTRLTLNAIAAAMDGDQFRCVVTSAARTVTTGAAALTVDTSRLVNLSARSNIRDADTLIVGFVVGGNGGKQVLLRAIGPGLAPFGVGGTLPDPQITLFEGDGRPASHNDNWGGGPALRSAFSSVGAFALPEDSKDAAIALALSPGSYTAHTIGAAAGAGIALAEAYDTDASGSTSRLINFSARNRVGTDAGILIAGFVVQGNRPKPLLIRAVGPTLAEFGVHGALSDPRLELHGASLLQSNDDWGGTASLANAFAAAGAFALAADSRDAALVATLPPGSYTALVSGIRETTGVALVEIYELP